MQQKIMLAEIAALVWGWLRLVLAVVGGGAFILVVAFITFVVSALFWWTSIRVQPPVPGAADGYQSQHFQ